MLWLRANQKLQEILFANSATFGSRGYFAGVVLIQKKKKIKKTTTIYITFVVVKKGILLPWYLNEKK